MAVHILRAMKRSRVDNGQPQEGQRLGGLVVRKPLDTAVLRLSADESKALGRLVTAIDDQVVRVLEVLRRQLPAPDPPASARPISRVASDYLTVRQAAEYLQLPSESALRKQMNRGSIPAWCYSRLGRSIRLIRSALDEMMQDEGRRWARAAAKARRDGLPTGAFTMRRRSRRP